MERTRDSSDKQALASASDTVLTTKSFPEWKAFIEEKATGHRKAGQALISGRPVNLREPERDDKRKNFPEWKAFIEEKATGHRKAGQALRSGRPVNLREPERDDKRNRICCRAQSTHRAYGPRWR